MDQISPILLMPSDRVTSRSKMIPKYPDLVEWFLIDRHFSKQWSDHNYDHAPHGTGKEQDLSFHMACI